jgi:hypothetical protein
MGYNTDKVLEVPKMGISTCIGCDREVLVKDTVVGVKLWW